MKAIYPQKQARQLTTYIKDSFQKEGYTEALVAVSGGVDSATSLMLTARALGPTHVHAVLLPYGRLNTEETKDAKMLIASLKIPQKNF